MDQKSPFEIGNVAESVKRLMPGFAVLYAVYLIKSLIVTFTDNGKFSVDLFAGAGFCVIYMLIALGLGQVLHVHAVRNAWNRAGKRVFLLSAVGLVMIFVFRNPGFWAAGYFLLVFPFVHWEGPLPFLRGK